MALVLLAPAKLNLTLEVLRRRPDGYHEIASLMQTIDLADELRLELDDAISLEVEGDATSVPHGADNLAWRAAHDLRTAAGRPELGARILLSKRIPAAAGLGGGSSDAAAVLRGLDRLWHLDFGIAALSVIAAGLGFDVPFFLHGGTALATGRGETSEPLPDLPALELALGVSTPDDLGVEKTRRMYAALSAADYSDGSRTHDLVRELREGAPLSGVLINAFDGHLDAVALAMAAALAACRAAGLEAHAAGSGPSFFAPTPLPEFPPSLLARLEREWGVRAVACRSLSREAALAYARSEVAQVFAGFICGYGLAILATPFCALLLMRLRGENGVLARALPEGASIASVAVVLHVGLFVVGTGAGIVLGLVLLAMQGSSGALGSVNAAFSLFVGGVVLMFAAPLAIVLPGLRRATIAGALVVLAVFGWLMPYLARWSHFS